MPSEYQSSADRERAQFPAVRERIGEDPARYLDYTAPEHLQLARARIRGIDSQDVIVEWLKIERELSQGPRETVVEWLQTRNRELLADGDRDEHLDTARDHDAIEPTASVAEWPDRDGGERSSPYSRVSSRRTRSDGGAES